MGICGGLFCGSPVVECEGGVEVTGSGSENCTTTIVTITCVNNRLQRKTQMVVVGITIRAPEGEVAG